MAAAAAEAQQQHITRDVTWGAHQHSITGNRGYSGLQVRSAEAEAAAAAAAAAQYVSGHCYEPCDVMWGAHQNGIARNSGDCGVKVLDLKGT
jgi:hypothetical protein